MPVDRHDSRLQQPALDSAVIVARVMQVFANPALQHRAITPDQIAPPANRVQRPDVPQTRDLFQTVEDGAARQIDAQEDNLAMPVDELAIRADWRTGRLIALMPRTKLLRPPANGRHAMCRMQTPNRILPAAQNIGQHAHRRGRVPLMKHRLLIVDRRPRMRRHRQYPLGCQHLQESIDDRIRAPINGTDSLQRTVDKNHIASANAGLLKQ